MVELVWVMIVRARWGLDFAVGIGNVYRSDGAVLIRFVLGCGCPPATIARTATPGDRDRPSCPNHARL